MGPRADNGVGGREAATAARPPVPLIFAITATGITVNTLVAPAIPEILAALGASPGLSGLVVGAATLPGILLAPVIGLLADRFGRREVLVPCLVLFGVAGGLAALAPSLWLLVLLRLLQGVGSAGLINLAVVLIGDHWVGADRARLIGRNAAVLTVSIAVLPALGGTLTELVGWRAVFAVYPLALLTAVALRRAVPRSAPRDVDVRELVAGMRPLLRSPLIRAALAAGSVTFALIYGMLITVLPLYLDAAFRVSPAWRGVLLGLPAVLNTAAALSLGWLRQRVDRRTQLVAACAVFVSALGVLAGASTIVVLAAGLLLFGLGEGLMVPNLQDIATGAAPARERGTMVALFVSASRAGQTVGPVAAGAAFASAGASAAFLGGATLAGLLLLGLAWLRVRGGGGAPNERMLPG